MKLTPKQIKESKRLSEINDKSKYFLMDGEWWKLVGTWRNKNGSWTSRIKNKAGEFREEGHGILDKFCNNK